MRDVKSEVYFEQMKGRGVRTINDADLRQVTPDAKTKTRFVLIDAVGVTESQEERQPAAGAQAHGMRFDKLIDQIAHPPIVELHREARLACRYGMSEQVAARHLENLAGERGDDAEPWFRRRIGVRALQAPDRSSTRMTWTKPGPWAPRT